MDQNMQVTDRVLSTISKLETLLEESVVQFTFKPDVQWQESVRRMVSKLML